MRLAWLAPVLLLACGGSDEVIPDPGGPIDAEGVPIDGPSTDGGGTGADCGGIGGLTCADTHYCEYAENTCGSSDELGTCQPRPAGPCTATEPVCGCDGAVHDSDCDAQLAGVDVNDAGGCTAPADTFACGHGFCSLAADYCERQLSDVGGTPDSFSCQTLPGPCGATPDCACLAAEPCGASCAGDATVGLTLTCPGG